MTTCDPGGDCPSHGPESRRTDDGFRWSIPVDGDGKPLVDDETVRVLFEISTGPRDLQQRLDRAAARRLRPEPCPDWA